MDIVLGLDTNKHAGKSETCLYLNYVHNEQFNDLPRFVSAASQEAHTLNEREREGKIAVSANRPSRFASHHVGPYWTI